MITLTATLYHLLFKAKEPITKTNLCQQLSCGLLELEAACHKLITLGSTLTMSSDSLSPIREDILLPDWIAKEIHCPLVFNPNSQSTQDDAKRGMSDNNKVPCLYLAPSQTSARGRFGRPFFTSQMGIYMTLHLKLADDMTPAMYTMMVAAAIAKAIDYKAGVKTAIKWVNDIYLNQKKIAGILTESFQSTDGTHLLIGVGINFAITHFPDSLTDKAGSLFQESPPITRNELIVTIWQLFFNTPPHELLKLYRDKSFVLDQLITFQENDTVYTATALDISDQGELLVQLTDGSHKYLNSGEISLITYPKS